MSQTIYPETSSAFVDQLLAWDNEIAPKMRTGDKNVNEIFQMYLDRLSMYEKSCILPLTESDKLLLQAKKEDIYVELMLYTLKQNLKSQLDDIQTGLDALEKNS